MPLLTSYSPRIWLFSNKNVILAICLTFTALVELALEITVSVQFSQSPPLNTVTALEGEVISMYAVGAGSEFSLNSTIYNDEYGISRSYHRHAPSLLLETREVRLSGTEAGSSPCLGKSELKYHVNQQHHVRHLTAYQICGCDWSCNEVCVCRSSCIYALMTRQLCGPWFSFGGECLSIA